jgi:uncharacterized protein YdhG (YjbR/CyaY superfamily)
MTVIDDYLGDMHEPYRTVIAHMYDIVKDVAKDPTEERYYGMPAFKYRGKGLVSILANRNFLSLYPYCAIQSLGLNLSSFEHTSGSIHFSVDKPLPDDLLRSIITARIKQIDARLL